MSDLCIYGKTVSSKEPQELVKAKVITGFKAKDWIFDVVSQPGDIIELADINGKFWGFPIRIYSNSKYNYGNRFVVIPSHHAELLT